MVTPAAQLSALSPHDWRALSGGGLVAGIAGALAEREVESSVVGVSADRAAVMLASVRAGERAV